MPESCYAQRHHVTAQGGCSGAGTTARPPTRVEHQPQRASRAGRINTSVPLWISNCMAAVSDIPRVSTTHSCGFLAAANQWTWQSSN